MSLEPAAAALNAARARGGRLVVVGTSAVRTLETVTRALGAEKVYLYLYLMAGAGEFQRRVHEVLRVRVALAA